MNFYEVFLETKEFTKSVHDFYRVVRPSHIMQAYHTAKTLNSKQNTNLHKLN